MQQSEQGWYEKSLTLVVGRSSYESLAPLRCCRQQGCPGGGGCVCSWCMRRRCNKDLREAQRPQQSSQAAVVQVSWCNPKAQNNLPETRLPPDAGSILVHGVLHQERHYYLCRGTTMSSILGSSHPCDCCEQQMRPEGTVMHRDEESCWRKCKVSLQQ